MEMDREMKDMIEGALPAENCQDEYWRAQKEAGEWRIKFWDAEQALNAITGGNADLALKLVKWKVLGRSWYGGTNLPRRVMKRVAQELRDLDRVARTSAGDATPAEHGADEAAACTPGQ